MDMKHFARLYNTALCRMLNTNGKRCNKWTHRFEKLCDYAQKTYPWCNQNGRSVMFIVNANGRYISISYGTEDAKVFNPRNKVKDYDTMIKLVEKNYNKQ